MIERHYERIAPVFFTADGGADGTISVDSVGCFKVKQKVKITALGQDSLILEIKEIPDYTTIIVGPFGSPNKNGNNHNMLLRTDLSAYTVASSASITAERQKRNSIAWEDIRRAVYEEEPTVALRTFSVDKLGKPWAIDNPFPVQLSEGSVEIGTVNAELEVQLSHRDDYPDSGDVHDSVRVGDGDDLLEVNDDGSINVNVISGSVDTPVIYTETGSFTDTSETEILSYAATNDNIQITKIVATAQTFGIWRIYDGTVAPGNLVATYRSSPTQRNMDISFDQPIVLESTTDTLKITFQAQRYRSQLLGGSASTFTRIEGYY